MSKVSLKNELLPSFEPIEQKGASQKRKRVSNNVASAALKDASSNGDSQPAAKKPKAKKNSSTNSNAPSVTINKSVVWIGATLMQEQEDVIKNEEMSAAYCIYYGLNDSRNCTEKITIQQNQNLDHVYTLGVIRALENCENDSSALRIHTGSKLLQTVIEEDVKRDSEICNQIKEKIAKRKGSTSIRYKARSSSNKEDEYQFAHNLAAEKLLEDKMMVDDEETLVDSLEVTETTNTEVSVTTTTAEITIATEENKEVEKTVITTIEEEVITVEPLPSPSWAKTLSLRNLLDVLKAPFYRNNKQK